jgi:hypothetical protein
MSQGGHLKARKGKIMVSSLEPSGKIAKLFDTLSFTQ